MLIAPYILAFLLVFSRTLGVVGTAPLIGSPQVPALWKIGLSFYLALTVYTTIPAHTLTGQLGRISPGGFIEGVVVQSLAGAAIGLLSTFVFAAVQFAGEIIDVNAGLAIANALSPGLVGPTGLISNFQYVLFALWFLSVNGHYAILLALLDSFRVMPLAAAFPTGPVADTFWRALISLFVIGVQLAAPVLLALLLTNVSLAIASRAVPQLNVFVVGLNITMLVGIGLLFFVMPELVTSFSSLLNALETQLGQLLQGLGGKGP